MFDFLWKTERFRIGGDYVEILIKCGGKEVAALMLAAQERREKYIMSCLLGTSIPFEEELGHKHQSTDQ